MVETILQSILSSLFVSMFTLLIIWWEIEKHFWQWKSISNIF